MRRKPQAQGVLRLRQVPTLCTTAGIARYLAAHSHLDPARVSFRTYPSGHMAYVGEESARQLAEDLRAFYASTLE